MARTVLLADDSVTAQNMGRRILMDAGYEVITVNNGSAALKKIHEHRPDLIVLDVYMPGYGGLEVCQRLKESADTARIPVLLSVGKMEPFKADEAKRVRADGHIVKPFEASELLAALTKLEDRIVPADSRDGRSGKPEKKGRTWQTPDTVIGIEAARSDSVAYLSEAKKRNASSGSGAAAQEGVNPSGAPAASADQPPAESVTVTPGEAQSSESTAKVAAVETPAVEARAVQSLAVQSEDSQEWVLGKTVFGKPAHGELALGESIFNKTVFDKAVAEKSVSGKSIFGKSEPGVSDSDATAEVATVAKASAPRWVAESVPLTAEETALDLDAEMQRSRAITAAVAIATESAPQEQVTTSDAVVAHAAPDAVAELKTASPAEAAFAAAAAAGATGIGSQHGPFGAQPAQHGSEATAEVAVPASEVEPAVAYEAAAAWENWQQIREAVMSPKKVEALAESVAEMATESATVPATSQSAAPATAHPTVTSAESGSESAASPAASADPSPSVIAAAAAAEEANSINDIVDSVLADMKPRLMAEIAKKLAAKK